MEGATKEVEALVFTGEFVQKLIGKTSKTNESHILSCQFLYCQFLMLNSASWVVLVNVG